jgi:flagellar hook-basal body complex protein FliE
MIPAIPPISGTGFTTPAQASSAVSPATTGGNGEFSNVLGSAIDQVNQTMSNASTLELQGATGQASVANVTVAASEAQLAIELVANVRNNAVTSFNSIMSMVAG